MRVKTLEWKPDAPGAALPGCVRMVDQTRLPERLEYLEIREVPELWAAIRELKVRGAPAIGVAAGFGILLAVQQPALDTVQAVLRSVEEAAAFLAGSRPTAVNLFWALERMRRAARTWGGADASASGLKARLAGEAFAIIEEDGNICRAIGEQGSPASTGTPPCSRTATREALPHRNTEPPWLPFTRRRSGGKACAFLRTRRGRFSRELA